LPKYASSYAIVNELHNITRSLLMIKLSCFSTLCLFSLATAATLSAHPASPATLQPSPTSAPSSAQGSVKKATAVLWPTQGNRVKGTVTFTAVDGGVKVVADVDNLTPGKHGFHVHEFGDCSAHDGSSAGGHFNPTGKKHGGPDSPERHMGDLGNLEADQNGHAHYERVDAELSLDGPNSIVGHSLVVHADEDDLTTQPTGNSGARVACGPIEK
jgi:Cu-Zn family superoxide dismutase